MKSTLVSSTLALSAAALLGACFYEVGDLVEPGNDGGSGGAGSPAGSGTGASNAGGSTGSGGSMSTGGSGGSMSGGASTGGQGGDGGQGGAPLQFLSCRQDAKYFGVCGGDAGNVLVWLTEVPVDVQEACETPQAINPRCLVRHCTEELAGPCGESAECGTSGITSGLTCLGDPMDDLPPSAIHDCSVEPAQCIGNIAVKPDPGDDHNCLFHDCAADGATCTVVAGEPTCSP